MKKILFLLLFVVNICLAQDQIRIELNTTEVIDLKTIKLFGGFPQEEQIKYKDSLNKFIIDIHKYSVIWNIDTFFIADYSFHKREKYYVFLLDIRDEYKYMLYYIEKKMILLSRYKKDTDTWFY